MQKTLPLGKIAPALLSELLQLLPAEAPELIVPPGIGRDAAGLKLQNPYIAVTTDPITFSTDRIATYSLAVNMNDVACLGCRPRWYSATLLLPQGTTENQLRSIWIELAEQCRHYQVVPIGGHVEVTTAVNVPVLTAQVIGEPIGEGFLDPGRAKAGDAILMWQTAGLEGTALLAYKHEKVLKEHFPAAQIAAMKELLDDPGICIWPFVKRLLPNPYISALHDPTEGGIATALHEIADASSLGLEIWQDKLLFDPHTLALCQHYQLNPLGLLSSGVLIIICKDTIKEAIIKQFAEEPIAHIGYLTLDKQRILINSTQSIDLPRFEADEIIKAI